MNKQHIMTKISVNEVTKRYADHTALDRMCIEIPERCIYGLLGPNGAGKTTLIRILNQITAPDTARARPPSSASSTKSPPPTRVKC